MTTYINPPDKCDMCGAALYDRERTREIFYDGKTKQGPWANMCRACFLQHGVGLGLGRGQEYTLSAGGFVKTGG